MSFLPPEASRTIKRRRNLIRSGFHLSIHEHLRKWKLEKDIQTLEYSMNLPAGRTYHIHINACIWLLLFILKNQSQWIGACHAVRVYLCIPVQSQCTSHRSSSPMFQCHSLLVGGHKRGWFYYCWITTSKSGTPPHGEQSEKQVPLA